MGDRQVPPVGRDACLGIVQAAQRRGACQREALVPRVATTVAHRTALANRGRQRRVRPKRIVIVEVFVASDQAQDALRYQVAHGVLRTPDGPFVFEAGRNAVEQLHCVRRLRHEQQTRVGRHPTGIEVGFNSARTEGWESELRGDTVCSHRLFQSVGEFLGRNTHTMDWTSGVSASCDRSGLREAGGHRHA